MENKMELTYVAKDDGTAEISVEINANGLELISMTLDIVDSLATEFSRNTMERKYFLKTVSDMISKLP